LLLTALGSATTSLRSTLTAWSGGKALSNTGLAALTAPSALTAWTGGGGLGESQGRQAHYKQGRPKTG